MRKPAPSARTLRARNDQRESRGWSSFAQSSAFHRPVHRFRDEREVTTQTDRPELERVRDGGFQSDSPRYHRCRGSGLEEGHRRNGSTHGIQAHRSVQACRLASGADIAQNNQAIGGLNNMTQMNLFPNSKSDKQDKIRNATRNGKARKSGEADADLRGASAKLNVAVDPAVI